MAFYQKVLCLIAAVIILMAHISVATTQNSDKIEDPEISASRTKEVYEVPLLMNNDDDLMQPYENPPMEYVPVGSTSWGS